MSRVSSIFTCTLLLTVPVALYGKTKHPPKPSTAPQDRIEVVAHVPLTAGAVARFLETRHYRREYLYAKHDASKTVTLIDITAVKRPVILAEITFPAGTSDNLVAVTGSAALVSSKMPSDRSSTTRQTFRIMNFADPLHPAIQQQFDDVTAMAQDDKRGLIFLANHAGIWILQQDYAMDPEAEKEWEHMMLDNR